MSKKKNNVSVTSRSARIAKRLWCAFGIILGIFLLVIILIYNGVIGYTPEVDQLKNPTDKFASTVYTAGGEEMGRYYRSKGNRVYVDFDQLSPHLRNALTATEDVRFDDHSGIDMRALGRSIVKRIIMGNASAGGGSTITQQLAKQLYSPESSTLLERALQKPIEWIIAVKLERYFTKDEIVKMYFNQFDFLNNAVGIKTASFVYFGKDPASLNIQEAATLVGMCKNPSYYNPLRYKDRVRERRNVVFEQMEKAGFISAAECNNLKQLPLTVYYHKVDHNDGLAPYFREELRRVMTAEKPERKNYPSWNQQAFYDDSCAWARNPLFGWCHKNQKPDGSYYDVYSDGLKIYTTIDSSMQTYAENAVHEHMKYLQEHFTKECHGYKDPYKAKPELKEKLIDIAIRRSDRYQALKAEGKSHEEIMKNFNEPTEMHLFSYDGSYDTRMSPLDSLLYAKTYLRCGIMSMDPVTGHVKAYVGGPDFKFFKYDMVSTGHRQIGSTAKPFVYSEAIQNGGLTPCTVRPGGRPNVFWDGKLWNPKGGGGTRTLKQALTASDNSISAGFMKGTKPNWIEERGEYVMTPGALIKWMRLFGITSNLTESPTLALGACEISLREMVTAYTAFANGGMRVDPIYVSRICDNHGNIIAEFTPQQTQVMSEDTHYKMVDMMHSVVASGTGTRLHGYFNTANTCGKTGTTNSNSDAWFMGYNPELVTGVWVGGEERYIHFGYTGIGQGAASALPIYGLFLKQVYADNNLPYSPSVSFKFPKGYNPCEGELRYSNPDYASDGTYVGGRRAGGGGMRSGGAPSAVGAGAASNDGGGNSGGGGGGDPVVVEGVFE